MQLGKLLRLGLPVLLAAALAAGGCTTVKKWAGMESEDEFEETAPPEARQETVMIDGKPFIRSKNPYWLTEPQYLVYKAVIEQIKQDLELPLGVIVLPTDIPQYAHTAHHNAQANHDADDELVVVGEDSPKQED